MLKDLYKVETLDTRFSSKDGQPLPNAQPSKWNTPEYYIYYLAFLTIPFFMFKSVYDVSLPSHPSYKHYESLLEDGWIPGRKVDNSDAQYAGFRENIPYMAILLILHPLLRRVVDYFRTSANTNHANGELKRETKSTSEREADARMQARLAFDLWFAAVFLLALHGISALKVLAILYINFQIGTALPKQYVAVSTWVFNIAILFANEMCQGYKFADFARLLLPATTTAADKTPEDNWGTWIDSYGGLIPRWEILFNITVLRLIAFNFDHLWMLDRRASSPIEVCFIQGNVKISLSFC